MTSLDVTKKSNAHGLNDHYLPFEIDSNALIRGLFFDDLIPV